MENASIENIDSTRIENARFRFPRNGEEMKVLRMRILFASQVPRATGRNGTGCDLSTDRLHQLGLGTPQNDALQHWKDRKQKTDSEPMPYGQRLRLARRKIPSASSRHGIPLSRDASFNYAFMKEHINQTVGKFLYKMIKTSLTEELRKGTG